MVMIIGGAEINETKTKCNGAHQGFETRPRKKIKIK
jgi:hypothetical protein